MPPSRRLIPYKRPRGRLLRWACGVLLGTALLCTGVGLLAGVKIYARYSQGLPSTTALLTYHPAVMGQVLASNNQVLADFAAERRVFVPLSGIPTSLQQAFISAEDQHFWTNPGIDIQALIRAAITDARHQDRRLLGGSTITQQLVKNMLVGNQRSIERKIREAILAIRLTKTLGKSRILELYLNQIYLGAQSYGVEAAAETYFGCDMAHLTLAQDALLAALPKAPEVYNPLRDPFKARVRRNWVLTRMYEDHAISKTALEQALLSPLELHPTTEPKTGGGSYFVDAVRTQLDSLFGHQAVLKSGYIVHTTLNPALQAAADTALRAGLIAYDRSHRGWAGPIAHGRSFADLQHAVIPPGALATWQVAIVGHGPKGWMVQTLTGDTARLNAADIAWTHGKLQVGDIVLVEPNNGGWSLCQVPVVQGALVALDPRTGRVLAMSGGFNYAASQFNRAMQALRQPGSSFKPIVYLAGMEQGIAPNALFLDGPFRLTMPDGSVWSPEDYEKGHVGMTPLHVALRESLNLPTVRLAEQIGMAPIQQLAASLRVTDTLPNYLSAALGTTETTVLRMASAYATLDQSGRLVSPSLIDTITDSKGTLVADGRHPIAPLAPDGTPGPTDRRPIVADPASVFQVVMMMQDVVARGTGVPAKLGLDRPLAGKTGTSQDFHDAWFIGFSPDLVTAVWVGFDQPSSLGSNSTGGHLAAPIWNQFMRAAEKGVPVTSFAQPPGVSIVSWDTHTGNPSSTGPQAVRDAFKPGTEPGQADQASFDPNPDTTPESAMALANTQGGDQDGQDEQQATNQAGAAVGTADNPARATSLAPQMPDPDTDSTVVLSPEPPLNPSGQ